MAGRRVRILRVRLDLQGRLTPVSALGVVSIVALYQPCVRFGISVFIFPSISGFVRSARARLSVFPSRVHHAGITLPTNGGRGYIEMDLDLDTKGAIYLMVLPVRRRIHWGMGRF